MKPRIGLFIWLIAVIIGYIFKEALPGEVSNGVLRLILCLPVIEVIACITEAWLVGFEKNAEDLTCEKNTDAELSVRLKSRSFFPLIVDVKVSCDGEKETKTVYLMPRGTAEISVTKRYPMRGEHTLEAGGVIVCDMLNIIGIKRKITASAGVTVLPSEITEGFVLPFSGTNGEEGRNGIMLETSGVYTDVRPFEPGDHLKSVHWKNSAKRDELFVRVAPSEEVSSYSVTVDMREDGENSLYSADRAADIALTLARANPGSGYISLLEGCFGDDFAKRLALTGFNGGGALYIPPAQTKYYVTNYVRGKTENLIGDIPGDVITVICPAGADTAGAERLVAAAANEGRVIVLE